MAKKQFFLVVDSETTIYDHVADFGAAVVDRKGEIHSQCAVMVADFFGVESLFYDRNASGLWAQSSVAKREAGYRAMLDSGARIMASVNAINRWLANVAGKYNPELTAYNLAFDADKCAKSGIDLNMFSRRFCLWHAAVGNICNSRKYREFILQNHRFNTVTDLGNMSFQTNAEVVTGFINGQITDEPHTALEDVIGWELPILKAIVSKKNWRDNIKPYNWRDFQVKDNFKAG